MPTGLTSDRSAKRVDAALPRAQPLPVNRRTTTSHRNTPLAKSPPAPSVDRLPVATGRAGEESRFFNRELSWIEFNYRVLHEARDVTIPLLERLKFLAITASNLDEFTMVRVGSLQLLVDAGSTRPDPSGLTPAQQLEAISERMRQFTSVQYDCYLNCLEPKLAQAGFRRVRASELNERQRTVLEMIFEEEIFPILTPVAVTGRDDFPLLPNLTMTIAVRLAPAAEGAEPRYALIPLGRARQRFLTLPADSGASFMLLEEAVIRFVDRFFPGVPVEEAVPFRITRNADVELQEDLAFDLLAEMQQVIAARKVGNCVRLEIQDTASAPTREFLQAALEVGPSEVFALPGPLDFAAFMRQTDVAGFDHLRYEPWQPQGSAQLVPGESLFTAIQRRDVLLYHPYESFDPVVRLLEEAAEDPDVLAIKQTLYRTSAKSPIVAALRRAAQRGKYVTAVVELKARFDEARNIEWARDLERADVQVVYGVKGLKTHAKCCLIVRREPQGIVRYMHFGTGNYNEQTSKLYSDASLMTCNDELGADATAFFNAITGYSQPQRFLQMEMAPLRLRDKLLELIDLEIAQRRRKQRAIIMGKLNALVDEQMIEALYRASQEGVKIKLNVRGICCLRPGVPGLSENITVTSVVDRFLEHSRILYFYHGGDERLWISSADWMPRNLDRRVELLVPVLEPTARQRLLNVLRVHLQDNVKAQRLLADGTYEHVPRDEQQDLVRSQELLYRRACDSVREQAEPKLTMFEPHRAADRDE